MSEVPAHEHAPQGEWRKFSILALVFLGTVLIVALLRPFIFGRLVPAILGENRDSTIVVEPPSDPGPVVDDENGSMGEESGGGVMEEMGTVDESESAEEMPAEGEDPAADASDDDVSEKGDTAVDGEETQTHIVQPGETIYQIARQYDVSVDDIVAANKLTNPDILYVNFELIIPQN